MADPELMYQVKTRSRCIIQYLDLVGTHFWNYNVVSSSGVLKSGVPNSGFCLIQLLLVLPKWLEVSNSGVSNSVSQIKYRTYNFFDILIQIYTVKITGNVTHVFPYFLQQFICASFVAFDFASKEEQFSQKQISTNGQPGGSA